MGYSTKFAGRIAIVPPLNPQEIAYLRKFAGTRRMHRERGPYFVDGTGYAGQGHDPDIIDFNEPGDGQPGLWCHWVPTDDGAGLEWDGGEKFYYATDWMQYLIDHFLKSGAVAQEHMRSAAMSHIPDGFASFTFDHVLNGVVAAQGEEPEDQWQLTVENNQVTDSPRD